MRNLQNSLASGAPNVVCRLLCSDIMSALRLFCQQHRISFTSRHIYKSVQFSFEIHDPTLGATDCDCLINLKSGGVTRVIKIQRTMFDLIWGMFVQKYG